MQPETADTQAHLEWLRLTQTETEQLMLQKFQLESLAGLHHLHLLLEHYAFLAWEQMSLLYSIHQNTLQLPDDLVTKNRLLQLSSRMLLIAESDINLKGQNTDLLAVYRKGMESCGADSSGINTFLARLRRGESLGAILRGLGATSGITTHVLQTYQLLEKGALPQQLAVLGFTPRLPRVEVLLRLLDQLDRKLPVLLMRMRYYFDLEIVLQNQVFEPMATEALILLCGNNPDLWNACANQIRETALARAALLADARTAMKRV